MFYNNSGFDGDDPAAGVEDDLAITPEKQALLPGDPATFENYTSYTRGINGLMVDIAGLASTPTADDFEFRVGNDDDPAGWTPVEAVPVVDVRQGAGVGGADRVTVVWDDNAIEETWLQVTVLDTENTGLTASDVFYFGNAVGESGNSTTDAKVNAFDMLGARNNMRSFLDDVPIDFPFDYNRDQRVNVFDMLIARNHRTHFVNALKLITVPGAKEASSQAKTATLDWLREFDQSVARGQSRRPAEPESAVIDHLLADSCQ